MAQERAETCAPRGSRTWPTRLVWVKARLRRALSDLRRIIGGSVTFVECLCTRDPVEVALGQLSEASTLAVRGQPNRYAVTISNGRIDPQDVMLVIDIYTVDSPGHPVGHYAYFAKRLKTPSRASTEVKVQYDWLTRASFAVDGMASPPDDFWKGTCDRFASYSVNAILLDPRGKRLDFVTVHQELTL
jgi:hypothetical protein